MFPALRSTEGSPVRAFEERDHMSKAMPSGISLVFSTAVSSVPFLAFTVVLPLMVPPSMVTV